MSPWWDHLAGTYDGTTLRVYLNGKVVGSRPCQGPIRTDGRPLIIGADADGPENEIDEIFKGLIDEVVVFSRALTAEEITRLVTLR